jgi:7-cyano-7-deazaguanine synthase
MNYEYHKAVALLSGGLDSTTALAIAAEAAEHVDVLSFQYGQRHAIELERAKAIVRHYGEKSPLGRFCHYIQTIDLRLWGGSALTSGIAVPKDRPVETMSEGIPVTYVPARNTVFLAFAMSLAEAVGAEAVFGGWNALDYSGYPDCRPEYFAAMQKVFDLGTKVGVEKTGTIEIHAPLVHLTKVQIIQEAIRRRAPLELTWSCYDPQDVQDEAQPGNKRMYIPCGRCDSCLIRIKGFAEVGIKDPAL